MPFKAGEEWKGNSKGRPRKPEIDLVREAIEETAIEKKKTLWKHLIEQCYQDNNVLIAVAKKFMPDKIAADVTIDDSYDWQERRKELLESLKGLNASD